MAKKQIVVRVLIAVSLCGENLEPNTLVKGDEDLLKPLIESNAVSSNKADVDYCEKELGVEIINLADLVTSENS